MSLDTSTEEKSPVTEPLAVSDAALVSVQEIRDQEDDADDLVLRIEITGTRGREYVYDLSFATADEVAEGHLNYSVGDLRVAIEAGSAERLEGAELDMPANAGQGGLVIRNPNTPDPFAGMSIDLEGELPEKVTALLDKEVNPMLATHGGFAQLVGVDAQNNVFVNMGGGCQGCAASALTLRAGIRKSIMEAFPEVTDVIDATDHQSGENPFYS
jgi:Fe/S biogenesis protein NfuA